MYRKLMTKRQVSVYNYSHNEATKINRNRISTIRRFYKSTVKNNSTFAAFHDISMCFVRQMTLTYFSIAAIIWPEGRCRGEKDI